MMNRMLGLRPAGAAGCGWACATRVDAVAAIADAAASVVPASRMLRRLTPRSSRPSYVSRGAASSITDFDMIRHSSVGGCSSDAGRPLPHQAAKTEMARRRIDRLRMARGGAIAAAVVGRAQMRAALDDLARNP